MKIRSRSAKSVKRLDRLRSYVGSGVLLVAHRGARGLAPENTIAAFQKAVDLGCDMIEFDVHLSRDGHPVVHHDDDLVRCTNVERRFPGRSSYYVSDFLMSEISTLDAGAWYWNQIELPESKRLPFLRELRSGERSQHLSGARIELVGSGKICVPSLCELFEFAEPTRLLLNIEIKTIPRMYPKIAEKIVEQIAHFGLLSRTLISSFDHQQLKKIRDLDHGIATAVLSSDRLYGISQYLDSLDADAFHPGCYGEYDSLGFGSVEGTLQIGAIEEVLATGRWVNAWTCNSEAQIVELIEAGVTGIITDYPNRFPVPRVN